MKDGEIVNPVLSVKELADLKGCSPQWIRKLAGEQKLQGQKRLNADGSPEWVFPLKSLDPHLQLRYYKDKAAEMPGLCVGRKCRSCCPARYAGSGKGESHGSKETEAHDPAPEGRKGTGEKGAAGKRDPHA